MIVVPVGAPAPAPADAPTSASANASASETPVSVTVAGAAALRAAQAERASRLAPPQLRGGKAFGRPEALMIVGGAALLGGALVDGTAGRIISVTGLVVGLYGLYLYLQ